MNNEAAEIFVRVPGQEFWEGLYLDSEDAIEQIEFLISIAPRFNEMLSEKVHLTPNDLAESPFAEWITQDIIDDKYWAFAKPQTSARPFKFPERAFFKHWLRFIADYTGTDPTLDALSRGWRNPSIEEILEAFNPAARLAFLTAQQLFPSLDHHHAREAFKHNNRNGRSLDGWWVDPNQKNRKPRKKSLVQQAIERGLLPTNYNQLPDSERRRILLGKTDREFNTD